MNTESCSGDVLDRTVGRLTYLESGVVLRKSSETGQRQINPETCGGITTGDRLVIRIGELDDGIHGTEEHLWWKEPAA